MYFSVKYDQFQLEAFEHISKRHSIFVTAPTGSGKTEVCMKAIETVLRSSDTDRVMYVCPTKALVHQSYAELFARFQYIHLYYTQSYTIYIESYIQIRVMLWLDY